MTEALQKLIEYLQQVSPILWQSLLRQVYMEAAFRLVWVGALIIACIVLASLAYRFYKEEKDDGCDEYMRTWIFSVASTISGVSAFVMLLSAIMWFINPYFYAIRWIIESLTQG